MEHSTGLVLSRCAHCGGSLRPGAPWCTLCLTKTAPDPEPVLAAELDPLTAPLELVAGPQTAPAGPSSAPPAPSSAPAGWPCAACETANAFDATTCAACGAGFLEAVRLSEPPLLAVPLVGDLTRLDKVHLLGLAFAVAAVAVLATLLLGVLFS